MIKKKVALIALTLTIFSCKDKWGDYGGYKLEYDPNDKTHYYIALDKGQEVYAGDTKAEQLQKSTLVQFHRNENRVDSVYLGKGAYVIEPFVLKDHISFDEKFILVLQKPLDSIFGEILQRPYPHRRTEPSEQKLENSHFYCYWIINKHTDEIYGPLKKEEYFKRRKELGVPGSLTIRIE